MKSGETWKSKNEIDEGVYNLLKLVTFLGSDCWLVDVYLTDESIECAERHLISGLEIFQEYVKISNE